MAKDININFRASKEEKNEYLEVSKKIDISFSQIARQALRKEINELKKNHPLLQETSLTNEQLAKHAARVEV